MTSILMLCLVAATQPPMLFSPAREDSRAVLVKTVEAALESDVDLLKHHRGYAALLEKNRRIAAAEEAYAELLSLSGFRRVVGDLEEALADDAPAKAAFDQYYAFLAENRDVARLVDGLHRYELAQRDRRGKWGVALDYLRGNPDEAIRFLENPAKLKPTPDALLPLFRYFKKEPAVREELLVYLRGIHENARAHTRVYPWWQAAVKEGSNVAAAHRRLTNYFAGHGHQFWVWHRRNEALASEPHTRDWVEYWHRLVRRQPDLAVTYPEYLKLLRKRPGLQRESFARWDAVLKAVSAWPPPGNPPRVPPLRREAVGAFERRSNWDTAPKPVHGPGLPNAPEVKTPQLPKRPVKPQKPAKPDKPQRPERPQRYERPEKEPKPAVGEP